MCYSQIFLTILFFMSSGVGASTLQPIAQKDFNNGDVYGVDWLSKGSSHYLVYGGDDNELNKEIQIAQFVPSKNLLKLKESAAFGDENSRINCVSAINIDNELFIAAGGFTENQENELAIYKFEITTLSKVNEMNAGEEVHALRWFFYNSNYYLAVGATSTVGRELQVYQFDPNDSSLSLLTDANFYQGVVNAVDWIFDGSRILLAAGGNEIASISNDIKIYEFDPNTMSLTLLTATTYLNGVVYALRWYQKNTSFYLALGGDDTFEAKEIRVLQFNTMNDTLALVADDSFNGGIVRSIDWQEDSLGNTYLAVGGDDNASTDEVRVYTFDTNTNTLTLTTATASLGDAEARSVMWKTISGSLYLGVGSKYFSSPIDPVQTFKLV